MDEVRHFDEFLVVVRPREGTKTGLKLFKAEDSFWVISAAGAIHDLQRRRCRECKVLQIIGHYLMTGDRIVGVNGETEVPKMKQQLDLAEELFLKVRRERLQSPAESPREGLPSVRSTTESCALAAGNIADYPLGSALQVCEAQQEYVPTHEPMGGYLAVTKGQHVYVTPGSRTKANLDCMYDCDYVYAETEDGAKPAQGWLPICILKCSSLPTRV